jgi:transcriptional regulator with XRE-family HTH domain
MTLSELIRSVRLSQGLSLRDLAAKSGVHFATLQRIEAGKTREPSWVDIQKIAKTLNIEESLKEVQ